MTSPERGLAGPWGGLPQWLGAATWFGPLGASLVMLVLSAYLLVLNLQWRKEERRGTAQPEAAGVLDPVAPAQG